MVVHGSIFVITASGFLRLWSPLSGRPASFALIRRNCRAVRVVESAGCRAVGPRGVVVQADLERRRQFEAVVDVVYEPLQRYLGRRAKPADVSELLNDSLLVIWRRLDHIPLDDPLPWSYGVAKRCLANHRRGAQRRLRLVGRVIDRTPRYAFASHPPGTEFDHAQLETALYELDESDRELIRLWAWEQLEPREIAVVLDTTPNAVSLRLTRAKKKIGSSMERQSFAAAGHEGFGHGREPRS
jgi:RNA polymerase sigma-70 factor, ECF subfamily